MSWEEFARAAQAEQEEPEATVTYTLVCRHCGREYKETRGEKFPRCNLPRYCMVHRGSVQEGRRRYQKEAAARVAERM